MRGARPRTTRLRAWMVGLACALGLAAGCASKTPPQGGGASGSKADKARKDAEALALNEVKAEFVRKDSRTVRPPTAEQRERYAEAGITGNPVSVEYDVEVTADQVRELRSQERASAALRVVGMLVAAALAGFLFLRADEW